MDQSAYDRRTATVAAHHVGTESSHGIASVPESLFSPRIPY